MDALIYMIILAALLAGAAGYIGWRWYNDRLALSRYEAEIRELEQDRAIRQNLQHMLKERDAEIRRLRAGARRHEADVHALEERANQLNLSLFNESGRRILAEKEDGARRMKLSLMERQLDELNARIRQEREAARAREAALQEIIDHQQQRLDKLAEAGPRRPRRARQEAALDQVTINDILFGPGGEKPQ